MHVVALCLMAAAVAAAEPEAVVLEFTAPDRCPPCQQIAPLVHRLEREGYPLQIVNADENAFVCQQYRVTSIPTFVLKIAGREVSRLEGKPSESELRRLCERARLANTAAAAEEPNSKSQTPNAKSQFSNPVKTAPDQKSKIENPKSQEPIIRAKHDDSGILPKPNSTDPLHVAPRIRVEDSQGVNFGTGTIIDSCEGRTTILTCGHLFRKLDDKSKIWVDVFNGSKHETFRGQLVRYDVEEGQDIGVLWIPTSRPLPVATIAGLSAVARTDQHVFSVGCSGGDPPSKLQHRVTSLNRYFGPDNVECTGVPVQGRSGGGLFDTAGRLIGLCIAADQRDQRGLYCGLQPIHKFLDQLKLSHLYSKGEPRPQPESLAAREPGIAPKKSKSIAIVEESVFDDDNSTASTNEVASPFATSQSSSAPERTRQDSAVDVVVPSLAGASLGGSFKAAASPSDSADNFDPGSESEVVCIIRPLNNPRAASRVVIINRASSKFLSQLSGEVEQQAKPTSAVVREAKYAAPSTTSSALRQYRRTR